MRGSALPVARRASMSPRSSTAPEAILGAQEKLLVPISEQEVPNLKYVWQRSRTAIPPTGIVSYYQYMPLLWNTKKIGKPDSWADYWMPGANYGEEDQGPPARP